MAPLPSKTFLFYTNANKVSRGVSQSNYHPQDLPVSKITHLLYAFVGARADGTVYATLLDPWKTEQLV